MALFLKRTRLILFYFILFGLKLFFGKELQLNHFIKEKQKQMCNTLRFHSLGIEN